MEVSGDQLEEEAQQKLEPAALSCFLNTAACKLKMQLWQDALDSCNEVKLTRTADVWSVKDGKTQMDSYGC